LGSYRLRLEGLKAKKAPELLGLPESLEDLVSEGADITQVVCSFLVEQHNCKLVQQLINKKKHRGLAGLKIKSVANDEEALKIRFFEDAQLAFTTYFCFSNNPNDTVSLLDIIWVLRRFGPKYDQKDWVISIFRDDLGLESFEKNGILYFCGLKVVIHTIKKPIDN
jgi:hypothetical protein